MSGEIDMISEPMDHCQLGVGSVHKMLIEIPSDDGVVAGMGVQEGDSQ